MYEKYDQLHLNEPVSVKRLNLVQRLVVAVLAALFTLVPLVEFNAHTFPIAAGVESPDSFYVGCFAPNYRIEDGAYKNNSFYFMNGYDELIRTHKESKGYPELRELRE